MRIFSSVAVFVAVLSSSFCFASGQHGQGSHHQMMSHGSAADSIVIAAPKVRAVPPTSANTGMFFVMKNFGGADHALVKAESDIAANVELHTHIMEDGMAKMREVAQIDVSAGGMTHLQPGGLHVMMLGLHEPVREGQTVMVKFTFEDGSSKIIGAPVEKIVGGGHKHHHH